MLIQTHRQSCKGCLRKSAHSTPLHHIVPLYFSPLSLSLFYISFFFFFCSQKRQHCLIYSKEWFWLKWEGRSSGSVVIISLSNNLSPVRQPSFLPPVSSQYSSPPPLTHLLSSLVSYTLIMTALIFPKSLCLKPRSFYNNQCWTKSGWFTNQIKVRVWTFF